jgi:deazaflavin-dependent oxidoreductase (nitroreductase family)
MPVASPMMRIASALHSFAYRSTAGRLGGKLGRLPVLLLTTVGRKTGERRTVPLVYLRDGNDIVIVGSNGGHDWHPAWFHNLLAMPAAEVRIGGAKQQLIAAVAAASERERLWPAVVKLWPGYGEYQNKTRREIPLVILRGGKTLVGRGGPFALDCSQPP